jgi:hypothetical protein
MFSEYVIFVNAGFNLFGTELSASLSPEISALCKGL